MTSSRTVLIVGCWRIGSTALNLCLIRHPSIFGWPHEAGFFQGVAPLAARLDRVAPEKTPDIIGGLFTHFCHLSGWRNQPWVVHKDPQDARNLSSVVKWCRPARIILLLRNPYAIAHSLLGHFFPTLREACFHIRDYYDCPLKLEAEHPELFFRVRYEDLATTPASSLSEVLSRVFALPMCEDCLSPGNSAVPRGLGDHKVQATRSWRQEPVNAWRVGLSAAEKEYVRANCDRVFTQFAYDSEDTIPVVREQAF